MAYTAPPTFTAGSVLSAAQMNILSDDIEYLYGKVGGAVPAVNAHKTTSTGDDAYYAFRYKGRYIHLKYVLGSGAGNHVRVYVDDGSEQKIFADESPNASTTNTAVIDLLGTAWVSYDYVGGTSAGGSATWTLSTGDVYLIHLDWDNGSNTDFTFQYIINSDSDTL